MHEYILPESSEKGLSGLYAELILFSDLNILSTFKGSRVGRQVGRYLLVKPHFASLLLFSSSQSLGCTAKLESGLISVWSTALPTWCKLCVVCDACDGLLWIILLTVVLKSLNLLELLESFSPALGACFSFRVSPNTAKSEANQKAAGHKNKKVPPWQMKRTKIVKSKKSGNTASQTFTMITWWLRFISFSPRSAGTSFSVCQRSFPWKVSLTTLAVC